MFKSWTPEVWERIDQAVHEEMHRSAIAAKFLHHHRVNPHVTTAPADTVLASLNGSAYTPTSLQANSNTPYMLQRKYRRRRHH